jgi:TolB-like protein/Flp pilus assembly protein TadD
MASRGFWRELKRRHVYRVAAAYALVGWLLIQVATQVFPVFHLPDWIDQTVVLLILLGFPIALVLAWAFDATPQGIVRTDASSLEGGADAQPRGRSQRAGIAVGLIGVLIAVAEGAGWWYMQHGRDVVAQESRVASTHSASAKAPVVRPALGVVAAAVGSPLVAQPIPAKSVAVLPLVNESGDKDQQYFSDGLSEDLITALSQFSGLKVINRESSFRFRNSTDSVREIGERLGVAHLLEGSVQRLGDQVRISAELVNATDGSTLWSQHYDRPYKDLFALQDDITKAVTVALEAKLLNTNNGAGSQSDRPPSGNLAAYNDFLQGSFYMHHGGEAGARKAIDYFTAATRLDPDYALAWSALGGANTGLAGNYLGGNEAAQTWNKARAEVQTALSLDPNLWQAHGLYSFILISVDHDWTRAEIEAEHAYQLNPDKAFFDLARVWGALGKTQQAVEVIQHGLSSDPLCPNCYTYLARLLPGLGRFDAAEQASRKAMQLEPGSGFARLHLVYIEAMHGEPATALQTAQQQPLGMWRDLMLAFALQVGSDRVAADKALQTVLAEQASTHAYYVAEMYALRRDPDNMFKWLERARANRDYSVQLLLTDPAILRYQHAPRFAALCKEVRLPTTTDAKALP